MNLLDRLFQKKDETPKRDLEKEYETELVKRIYERFHPKLRGKVEQETVIDYLQAIEVSMIHTNHAIDKLINVIEYQQKILAIE